MLMNINSNHEIVSDFRDVDLNKAQVSVTIILVLLTEKIKFNSMISFIISTILSSSVVKT